MVAVNLRGTGNDSLWDVTLDWRDAVPEFG
jgi:hypothetical protein